MNISLDLFTYIIVFISGDSMKILKSYFTIATSIFILSFCNAEDGFYLRKSVYNSEQTTGKFLYSGYDTRTDAMQAVEQQKSGSKYTKTVDNAGFSNYENLHVKHIAEKFANHNYTEKIMAANQWDEFDFFNNFYFYRIATINIYGHESLKKITNKLSNFLKSYAKITIDNNDIGSLIKNIKEAEESESGLFAKKLTLSDAIKVMLPAYFHTLTEIATKALLPEFTLEKQSKLKDTTELGKALRSLVFSPEGDWNDNTYVKQRLDTFFNENKKYIAPFDLFMILKTVQKHNGCPVINWHISRLMKIMHQKGSKYIVNEEKLVKDGILAADDSFQGNGSVRSPLYDQYKHIYDRTTIYADMHKLKNNTISQKVQFTDKFNNAEFALQKYNNKRCVTACYPNDKSYDSGGGMMGSVNKMSQGSGQNCTFENRVFNISNTYPISTKLTSQNQLLTENKNFIIGPHIQAMISNDCDLKCNDVTRKNYGVMWSTCGQTKEELQTNSTWKYIPNFCKNTYKYLENNSKDGRYAMNLIQSVILAINNEYDAFFLGGLAGCGIWDYFNKTYGAKEVASLLKPILIDLSAIIDKANLDILLSSGKGSTTWNQTLKLACDQIKN